MSSLQAANSTLPIYEWPNLILEIKPVAARLVLGIEFRSAVRAQAVLVIGFPTFLAFYLFHPRPNQGSSSLCTTPVVELPITQGIENIIELPGSWLLIQSILIGR